MFSDKTNIFDNLRLKPFSISISTQAHKKKKTKQNQQQVALQSRWEEKDETKYIQLQPLTSRGLSQTAVDPTQILYLQTLLPLGLCCLPALPTKTSASEILLTSCTYASGTRFNTKLPSAITLSGFYFVAIYTLINQKLIKETCGHLCNCVR